MKKIINILILVALVAIVVVQLKGNKSIAENRVYHYDKEKAIIVDALKVNNEIVNAEYQFTGTFDADQETRINADIQGKIVKYFVDQGSTVKKGQKLVQLDADLLQLQLQAVEVQIEGLEADIKRYQILSDADAIQGVKLEKAQMGLKAAKIQKRTLQTQIGKTTIKAPFDGVVTMKMSEVGSFAAPGVPLIMLSNIKKLRFKINVPESDLDLFQLNQSYKIVSDAYPNMLLSGKVISKGSKGNMGNAFPIQFALDNTQKLQIKSNMFGKVIMDDASTTEAITIPASAIIGSDLEPKVYVVENGKATLKPITVARRFQNKVVVGSGLKSGDQIITSGFINLFNGANVKIR
ncbi:MAG TPA: efflux RND transporter periplasmic adaptor subunit [Crocinitomix sp.]|nr:efflux RND transporter periplasmic adaptor subunit [Crocinitomix sp.]